MKKKGINVNSGRVIISLGLLAGYIGVLPLYFDPKLDVADKLIMTLIGALSGIGNYIFVIRAGIIFRKTFGIDIKDNTKKMNEK
ncbi:MAG: hypothetical protein Q7U74_03605 [Saprospiraceae bacterium]|nr:hypothetical protein [Saprospiraceae bacterium]